MQPFSQFDARGGLQHLITLDGLDGDLLRELLERAQHYVGRPGEPRIHGKELQGFTVANLFAEPSTRTRSSFELAAVRLGADVVNLDVMLSSRVKGESMLDTIYTLQAMQVDMFVIRDAQAGVTQYVAEHVAGHVSVVSAGEAHLTHPTQGLLDALTIRLYKGGFRDLVIAIVGGLFLLWMGYQMVRTAPRQELNLAGEPPHHNPGSAQADPPDPPMERSYRQRLMGAMSGTDTVATSKPLPMLILFSTA